MNNLDGSLELPLSRFLDAVICRVQSTGQSTGRTSADGEGAAEGGTKRGLISAGPSIRIGLDRSGLGFLHNDASLLGLTGPSLFK
jgi:hypothetical protein